MEESMEVLTWVDLLEIFNIRKIQILNMTNNLLFQNPMSPNFKDHPMINS